jgi:protein-disulfide isomerase
MENNDNLQENNDASSAPIVPEKKDRFLPVSILVAAVVVAGAIVFAAFYKGGITGNPSAPSGGGTTAGQTTSVAGIMALTSRDEILGNANAPVTLIEYGDYQCPYCAQFFAQTEPSIVQNYVNTGKVKMVFRNFAFLDRVPGVPPGANESHDAAAAAECATDQNKTWAYHDALYSAKVADMQKGGSEDDGLYNRTLFLKIAQQLKLDMPTFTSCIDSKKYQAQVDTEEAAANAVGVQSTPTFFINGQEIQGAEPYATFKATIDPLLK